MTEQSSGIGVTVSAMPDVALIRPAVEAALAGRAFPDGPEAAIGRAVADAVRARQPQPQPQPQANGGPRC